MGSREKNRESQLGARSGVANVRREWSRECVSRMGVTSGVANVSRECESRNGVANVSRERGSRN